MSQDETSAKNDRDVRTGKRLTLIFLLWPIVLVEVLFMTSAEAVTTFGLLAAPILSAVLVWVAMRHYPGTRRFLKIFVAVTFTLTIVLNYYCAIRANAGLFPQTIAHVYDQLSGSPLRRLSLVFGDLFRYAPLTKGLTGMHTIPQMLWFLVLQHCATMTGPYFLLLMFVTPAFLALPVFWLWVVLSVLYVVLPQRAWAWMTAVLVHGWKKMMKHGH